MDISKALQMYEVVDISQEDDKTLNKKYKRLAKKYHPDSYKDSGEKFKEVKEAYDMLLDLLKQIKIVETINKINTREEKLIHITFEELIEIYNNKHRSLTKQDLYKNRVLVMFTVSTLYKSDIQTITSVNLWNIDDKYSVDLEVKDENILEESSIDIKIGKENRHVDLKCISTKYIATLENNIKISITITKRAK